MYHKRRLTCSSLLSRYCACIEVSMYLCIICTACLFGHIRRKLHGFLSDTYTLHPLHHHHPRMYTGINDDAPKLRRRHAACCYREIRPSLFFLNRWIFFTGICREYCGAMTSFPSQVPILFYPFFNQSRLCHRHMARRGTS